MKRVNVKKKIKKKKFDMPWYGVVGLPVIVTTLFFIFVFTHGQTKPLNISELTRNNQTYKVISFGQLFFSRKLNAPIEIPEHIKALNGKKVAMQGFVMPLERDGKNLKTFMFVDQLITCMFCQGMGVTQWVMSTAMDSKGFNLNNDQYENSMIVYGTLEVGEEYKDGSLASVYRMKADGIEK